MSAPLPPRPCDVCSKPMVNPTGLCRQCQAEKRRDEQRNTLIAEIKAYYREHGVPPGWREVPSGGKAGRLFGSWRAAVAAAGYQAVEPGQNKRPSRKGTDRSRIALTGAAGAGRHAIVDPEDFDRLAPHHWNLGTDGYAYGRIDGRQTAMHRVILGLTSGDGFDCDHINGNRLDNRRQNLRRVTRGENLQNRTAATTGASRFRGVTRPSQASGSEGWAAKASLAGRTIYIGTFPTELEAAVAAQEWRSEHMPFAPYDPELEKVLAQEAVS